MKISTHKIITFEIELAELVKQAMSNLTDIMLDGINGEDNDLICMHHDILSNVMQMVHLFTAALPANGIEQIKKLLKEGFATYIILPSEITDALENDEEVIVNIQYNGKYVGSVTGEYIEF